MRRLLFTASLALLSSPAYAVDVGELDGTSIELDVTNASSILYNSDNRDFQPNQVNTLANDNWGLWYNRLNLQANWTNWQLGLRLDSAYFYASPNPVTIATDLERDRPRPLSPGSSTPAAYFRDKFFEAGRELSNRYINWIYPAKYYLGYSSKNLEVTVGDFYAQFGRGFVLSVRKMDELSSDTTVRGVRATTRFRINDWRFRLTALGGEMNPLRLDEASGRYLGVTDEVTPGWLAVTEAGMPRQVATDFLPDPKPTYAPDKMIAGQFEMATKGVKFGTQASMLLRQDPLSFDLVRDSKKTLTASQSISLPSFFDRHLSFYGEGALQELNFGEAHPDVDVDTGYALYGNATLLAHPFSLLFEGKHYRRFFPLMANVDLANAREFSVVQYNSVPTAEAFWVDTEFEGFNTCVTGGRAKVDAAVGADENVFAWVGRYNTWAESVANENCDTSDENLNKVWDVATGFEITSQERKSRANVTVGARVDDTEEPIESALGNETNVFYQENYVRYDIIRWITGAYSFQLQGWHRHRQQTSGGPDNPWWEGQHLTGFEWGGKLSVALGFEYDTNPQTPPTYFNGQVTWKFTTDSNLSLFVGQRRGTLRCVGGVCRVFPPFEGARLDVTARF